MKINRREFLSTFATFVASGVIVAKEDKPNNKRLEPQENLLNISNVSTPALVKTLRLIDPNLSSIVINLSYYFVEAATFYKANYKKFKSATSSISEAEFIHNNSDKWAKALSTAMFYLITYPVRFPFTVWIANRSSTSSEDTMRQNKTLSDFMTINTYYGQAVVDRYLTNALQHELREVYKKILKENPNYNYQPWAVSLNKVIQSVRENHKAAKSNESEKSKITTEKSIDKRGTLEWVKSRRNQLDLLLVSLSYLSTFVNVIPLVTANKLKIYSANTATGRMIGSLPYQSLISRNLLKKLKDNNDTKSYDEQKAILVGRLYNSPAYYIINSSIQSLTDSALGLKKYSDSDIAYSNLREIIGGLSACIASIFLQYKVEEATRTNKEHDKATQENLLAQFANWYISPS